MTWTAPRRRFFRAAGAFALSPAFAGADPRDWPPAEGEGVPKLCLGTGRGADEKEMRRFKQIGVDHVLMGGPEIPWTEAGLRALIERFRAGGLAVVNLMIADFPNTLYGRPGRGGAGMTAYGYERSKELPPLPDEGSHTLEEMWRNVTYFLKAVVPVAEHAGVRLALHPNDPPVPLSRGSEQIMASLEGWKRLVGIVDSPSNGITYDCGVTCEMGEDPVAVCRFFGERDRISHVHFRNVRVRTRYLEYTEVFPDEGQVDMFAVMKELVRQRYPRFVYPEHPRALDADREQPGFRSYYPGGGGYAGLVYNVAYTKAMLQAALSA